MCSVQSVLSKKGINITQEFGFNYNYGGQRAESIVHLFMAMLIMVWVEKCRKPQEVTDVSIDISP